jgi:hypothetical protein
MRGILGMVGGLGHSCIGPEADFQRRLLAVCDAWGGLGAGSGLIALGVYSEWVRGEGGG